MLQAYLAGLGLGAWSLAALLLLLGVFVAVGVHVLSDRSAAQRWVRMSRLPLAPDDGGRTVASGGKGVMAP